MRYVDYVGNVAGLAVDLVNGADSLAELSHVSREMFIDHGVPFPGAAELAELLPLLRAAVGAAADGGPLDPVNELLTRFPPVIGVSDHDARGEPHLHYWHDDDPPVVWLGRGCGAALAHVLCGDPAVTLGRCAASGCPRFYVDQSRNRSRRFCSNACASRTTVAAYRARRRTGFGR